MLLTCIQKLRFSRLQYLRFHQSQLHADLYQGLADVVLASDGQVDGSQLAKKIILPSSFTGGPRYQHQLYQDAMSIVRQFGKPDFCNIYILPKMARNN